MRNLSREFTLRESILLVFLIVVLIATGYYYFLHKPVKTAIEAANIEIDQLTGEIAVLNGQIAEMERMNAETDDPTAIRLGYMASYNNSEEEIRLLNNILRNTIEYTVTFSGVTRSGNQIRRNFTLHFRTEDYKDAKVVLTELSRAEYRCLIGDLRCVEDEEDKSITADASATFYETVVGGTPDAALPEAGDTVNP